MRILKVINDELIDIREYRNANATFNTNEYSKSDDICVFHEQFNPFDLYSDYEIQKHEIQRLNNNWNELKEWLQNVDTFQMNFIENKEHITPFKAVLEKIKEIEETK